MKTSDLLINLAEKLESSDSDILVRAEDDSKVLEITARALVSAGNVLRKAAEDISDFGPDISADDLEDLAVIASEYDKSGDPELEKIASVIDELVIGISANKDNIARLKQAKDDEISRLREKYRAQHRDEKYKDPHKDQRKEADEGTDKKVVDAINDKVKKYKPLEAPLTTRYCPDHPGESVVRIADHVYQCPLDNHIYDYDSGFETMKGNVVPGATVSGQTEFHGHRGQESMNFSTREQVLNDS